MWYSWKKDPNVYVQTSASLVRHMNTISCFDLVTNGVVCTALSTRISREMPSAGQREQSKVKKTQPIKKKEIVL